MGILARILGIPPEWARRLPAGLRPSASQVRQIEQIRMDYGLRHEELFMHLMSHRWITRRVLGHGYQSLKASQPGEAHPMLLATLLAQRLDIGPFRSLLGVAKGSPPSVALMAVSRFETVEDMADALAIEEAKYSHVPAAPGFDEPARRITEVLIPNS